MCQPLSRARAGQGLSPATSGATRDERGQQTLQKWVCEKALLVMLPNWPARWFALDIRRKKWRDQAVELLVIYVILARLKGLPQAGAGPTTGRCRAWHREEKGCWSCGRVHHPTVGSRAKCHSHTWRRRHAAASGGSSIAW